MSIMEPAEICAHHAWSGVKLHLAEKDIALRWWPNWWNECCRSPQYVVASFLTGGIFGERRLPRFFNHFLCIAHRIFYLQTYFVFRSACSFCEYTYINDYCIYWIQRSCVFKVLSREVLLYDSIRSPSCSLSSLPSQHRSHYEFLSSSPLKRGVIFILFDLCSIALMPTTSWFFQSECNRKLDFDV